MRRECLDYVIPLGEKHLRKTLREWVTHYNQGRPHSALGPGIPADTKEHLRRRLTPHARRHELPSDARITTREILGGLHHEYELERTAA
ncbi:MAG: integrase core domain-containing protein [Terriglobales bacterium]